MKTLKVTLKDLMQGGRIPTVYFQYGNIAEMLVEEMRKTEAGKDAAIIGEIF